MRRRLGYNGRSATAERPLPDRPAVSQPAGSWSVTGGRVGVSWSVTGRVGVGRRSGLIGSSHLLRRRRGQNRWEAGGGPESGPLSRRRHCLVWPPPDDEQRNGTGLLRRGGPPAPAAARRPLPPASARSRLYSMPPTGTHHRPRIHEQKNSEVKNG